MLQKWHLVMNYYALEAIKHLALPLLLHCYQNLSFIPLFLSSPTYYSNDISLIFSFTFHRPFIVNNDFYLKGASYVVYA